MHFGSVKFFKVLIKTVLAILFFVPLILAVVFGVLFAQKNIRVSELEQQNSVVQQENDKLSVVADVLAGQRAADVESIRDIINRSGVSYDEVIKLASEKNDIDAQGLYNILSQAGISDKDIISMAVAKKTVSTDEFYTIMSKNGITAKELIKSAVKNSGTTDEDFYALLSDCGLSDEKILSIINNKQGSSATPSGTTSKGDSSTSEDTPSTSEDTPSTSEDTPSTSVESPTTSDNTSDTSGGSSDDSTYAELYPDMYVTMPENYTYEEGTVYFTFDDGPSQYTYSYLQYLKQYNVKATWFVVPSREQWNMEALKAIADAGHTIGVHSFTHDYNKIYASVEAYLEDFYEAWTIIKDATGQTPQLFRFPGGSKNDFNVDTRDAIIKEMTRRGFRFYDWNVDSHDVDDATWQEMYNSIPNDCRALNRPVILMHDSSNRKNTLYVFEDVLKVLIGEGYKFDALHNDTRPVQFIGPFG